MGARPDTAWQRVYEGRKSLWALSHCGPVDRTLNNAFFAQRGLLSSRSRTVDSRGSSLPKNSSRSTWIAAGGNAGAGARD
jgi:hypothetical protein